MIKTRGVERPPIAHQPNVGINPVQVPPEHGRTEVSSYETRLSRRVVELGAARSRSEATNGSGRLGPSFRLTSLFHIHPYCPLGWHVIPWEDAPFVWEDRSPEESRERRRSPREEGREGCRMPPACAWCDVLQGPEVDSW